MPEQNIILFSKKEDCCGCQACVNACPANAIKMEKDEYGFIYPLIHDEQCISCGICKKVCNYQKKGKKAKSIRVFAAVWKDKKRLQKSSSGGVFGALACEVLKRGGVVFGCSLELIDGRLTPKHTGIDKMEDLWKIQGSKYVHSLIGETYKEVKGLLDTGKEVLFTGTPCQIDGLYGYLQNREHENLLTIDLICHGVPSISLFQDYIDYMEKKRKIKVVNFRFRNKKAGWGLKAEMNYYDKKGRLKRKIIANQLSSYYTNFLNCDINRINCYSCKYASGSRIGDISVGDFWGIKNVHPEYLTDRGGNMEILDGISCLLVNSEHGEHMLRVLGRDLLCRPATFDEAAMENGQLKEPAYMNQKREILLNAYKDCGYEEIEKIFKKQMRIKKYVYMVWNALPWSVQKMMKKKI